MSLIWKGIKWFKSSKLSFTKKDVFADEVNVQSILHQELPATLRI